MDASETTPDADGFRPRRVRPVDWEAQAKANGTIPDPDNPAPPHTPSGTVVHIPVATSIVRT